MAGTSVDAGPAVPAAVLTCVCAAVPAAALAALGTAIASLLEDMQGFQLIMNFVIFPMFFASSALYPLWKMQESSVILYRICTYNPFTAAVEIIRFGLYAQWDWPYLGYALACTAVFLGAAIIGYDPARGLIARKAGAGA